MKVEKCINLDATLEWLEINSDADTLKEWVDENEESATVSIHHTVGRGLRNELGLWTRGEEQTEIAKYFNSIGIFHGDDMSGIILTSFHRKLNKKDLELNKQVSKYRKYWAIHDPKINLGFIND